MTNQNLFQPTKLVLSMTAAFGISSLYIAPVNAQEKQENKNSNALLEVISVTANRRSQSETDVPYNISATSSEQLELLGITDFTKLARNSAGLTFVESGARNSGVNSGLIIRGLNTRSSLSTDLKSAQDPTVSTYLGETALFANFVLKDIERVEILRGPQGTLYGSGSLGGTLRYIPNKPSVDSFSANIATRLSSTEHGSGLNSDTSGMVNIPLTDNIAFRAVGGYSKNQGFIDANTVFQFNQDGTVQVDSTGNPVTRVVEDSNWDDNSHIRASLLWNVAENATAVLSHHRQKDKAGGVQVEGGYDFGGGEYAHANRILEPLEREIELTALDIEIDLEFATLSSNTSIASNDALMTSDQSGIYRNADWYYSLSYYLGPSDVTIGANYTQEESSTAQELRLVSNSDGPVSWVGGVFYRKLKQENNQYDVLVGYSEGLDSFYPSLGGYFQSFWTDAAALLPDPNAQVNNIAYFQKQTVEFTDFAVFGEINYRITDRLQATVGVRKFKQEYKANSDIYLIGCSVTSTLFLGPSNGCGEDPDDLTGKTGGDLSLDINDMITKVNFSYKIDDTNSVYFTRAEGFRHGGTNGIPITGDSNSFFSEDPELSEYKQDEAVNYEIGVKGRIVEKNIKYAAAVYYIDWDNIQIDGSSPNGSFPIVYNGRSARSTGLEFESTIGITADLTLTTSYTYTNAELTEDFSVGGITGYKGDKLPNVPEHSASWSLSHFTSVFKGGGELRSNINGNYVSSAQSDLNTDSPDYSEYGGYSLLNASISLLFDQWEVSVFVDNLTNKRALTNTRGSRYANPINPQSGRDIYSFVNRPRTFGVSFKYAFY